MAEVHAETSGERVCLFSKNYKQRAMCCAKSTQLTANSTRALALACQIIDTVLFNDFIISELLSYEKMWIRCRWPSKSNDVV